MSYPRICTVWCKNFGTTRCPTSSVCMATAEKPYFKVKETKETWFERWLRKREIKSICKANRYNCAECVYHEFIFEGVTFRGVLCRLKAKKGGADNG